MGPVLNKELE